jgi:hypothetical protein
MSLLLQFSTDMKGFLTCKALIAEGDLSTECLHHSDCFKTSTLILGLASTATKFSTWPKEGTMIQYSHVVDMFDPYDTQCWTMQKSLNFLFCLMRPLITFSRQFRLEMHRLREMQWNNFSSSLIAPLLSVVITTTNRNYLKGADSRW